MDHSRGHASFSQLSLAASCGEAYRRAYVENERDPSSVPAEAGIAFHEAVKEWECIDGDNPDLLLYIAKQRLRAVPTLDMLKCWGAKDVAWWLTDGLETLTLNYCEFRAQQIEGGWNLWSTPELSLEVEVTPTFGGEPFLGYIDQVLLDPRGWVVIRDLKSGRQKPWHAMQLQFYMLAFVQQHDVDYDDIYGQILYLGAKGPKVVLSPLTLTMAAADRMVSDLSALIRNRIFPATGPFNDVCGFCSYRPDCPWGQVGLANTKLKGKK